ncbi:MAG TPA: methyltransferase domain-containing protein [Acidimicrobiales bacterium]|nr:methyltransferase domain-containing protein [Acidimicrobiales bacterium]
MQEISQDQHRRATKEAYDMLAPAWSKTTDDGPYNGWLERPAMRSVIPMPLAGKAILDAACGSGAQCEWLADHGGIVTGFDFSAEMAKHAAARCGDKAKIFVADLHEDIDLEPASFDGITCSLALHYLRDWSVPLRSFARLLKPGGWVAISLDHPFGEPLASQEGSYFDTELVSDRWEKDGVEVVQRFWRRPLAAVVNAFSDAGFAVERIVETTPSPEALERFPAELGPIVGKPFFIVYRLRLV